MISGPDVVQDELSDAQRPEGEANNVNIKTGITGVPTPLYEVPEMNINEDIDEEEKSHPKIDVLDNVIDQNVEKKCEVVVETIYEE